MKFFERSETTITKSEISTKSYFIESVILELLTLFLVPLPIKPFETKP